MGHCLKLSMGKQPQSGLVALRQITVRERILRFLFGDPRKVPVLVPGDTVKELAISGLSEGGTDRE